jgi:hypothetical protein
MKYIFTMFLFTGWCILLSAQPCNSVNVSLINQSDVDGFLTQNGTCTEIAGSLVIGNNIENLDGLENIQKIGGYLSLSNADKLQNIRGLAGLQEVGEWIRIQNNPLLESLDGLQNLQKVRGDFFYISDNLYVKTLVGLSGLDSIKGIFQVWDMDSLTEIKHLSGLKYIGGDCSVFKNDRLLNMTGLDSLTYIGGALRIYENQRLQALSGLHPALKVTAQLAIYQNPELEVCNVEPVCAKLAAMPDAVFISDNKGTCVNKEIVITDCTSSADNVQNQLFTFYPNPAGDEIFTPHDKNITIYGIYNQESRTLRPENNTVNISFLPAGTYIIKINDRFSKLIKL